MPEEPFYKTKPLAEMTDQEWESLCDGCGRCCYRPLVSGNADSVTAADVRIKNGVHECNADMESWEDYIL